MPGSHSPVRRHRFVRSEDLSAAAIEIQDADWVKQLRKVLRLGVGDEFVIADGKGAEAVVRINEMGKEGVMVLVIERFENKAEPARDTALYCALLKRENFELVVQKAVEVGIKRIVPMLTVRTVKMNIKAERLNTIVKEAAEQSGRGMMPVLAEPMSFVDALTESKRYQHRFFLDVGSESGRPVTDGSACAFIGPEGGWSEAERIAAADAGLTSASLGALTLRAETAAIVAAYLLAQAA